MKSFTPATPRSRPATFSRSARRPESLTDTYTLRQLISKRVTLELLADVAAEYRKGRRLFVMTTNLDAGRTVVWNIKTIAAHGGEFAPALFRQILLARLRVPGVFPPV